MKEMELLAPVGNPQTLKVAINNGANAIYLGLNDFNARGNIENFNVENLRESVKKAHLFGVRVFLTLNTLLLDGEFEKITQLVRSAIDAKVDAFITQDIGLAYYLRNKFPNIELHASTQMGIQNLEGTKFLSPLGFKRVVLARETPLDEIRRIKDNFDVEIEYFVQGALCVSFSGNCYLCSILADASGNRGKCKQFCRLPVFYSNEEEDKRGYFLSTKDFCLLPKLDDLQKAGVDSLKIEGRARRPAYVGGAVNVYRNALDNNFQYNKNDIITLQKLFNRGNFIKGYFEGENIIYNKTQNHMGIKIGKVLSVRSGKKFNEIVVETTHALARGDSLKFFAKQKEACSLSVQDVKKIGKNQYLFTTTTKVPQTADVHLTVDSQLENEILQKTRKIPFKAKFIGRIGQKAKLFLSTSNTTINIEGDFLLEGAKASPFTKADCYAQLSKSGEEFYLSDLDFDSENVFMAKSQINQLRRNAISLLREKIIENNEKNLKIEEKEFNLKIGKKSQKNGDILYFSSLETLKKYINTENFLVYDPSEYNIKEIEEFCKKHSNKTIYLHTPIISNKNMIDVLQKLFEKVQNLGVVATNYYAFSLTTPQKTIVGSDMNIANSFAIEFYQNLGYDKIILSKENFDFSNIKNGNAQLFVENNFSKNLMHFKHCPFKENLSSQCDNCKYKEGATYGFNCKKFAIVRKRLSFCQFVLKENKPSNSYNENFGNVIEIK